MVRITSKKLIDALNKYVYIVPSIKNVILAELGLVYNQTEDTWTKLDDRHTNTSFLDITDETEDSD